MDNLTKSIAGMLDALTPALQKLSETFCVSIDYLRANAMYYILEYGKYCMVKTLVWVMLSVIVAEIAIGIAVYYCTKSGMFAHFYYTLDMSRKDAEKAAFDKMKQTKPARLIIATGVLLAAAISLCLCLPYLASPEMYSIEKVMNLMGGM